MMNLLKSLVVGSICVLSITSTPVAAFSVASTNPFLFQATSKKTRIRHYGSNSRFNTALPMEQVYGVTTATASSASASTGTSSQKMEKAMMKNEQKQRLPSWIDLPLAAQQSNEAAYANSNNRLLRSAELAVGRVAMVGAILMILGEIMTGQTFWQQMLQSASAQVPN